VDRVTRRCGEGLRARRQAALRLEPLTGHLSTCFGGRDPLAACTCSPWADGQTHEIDFFCCASLGLEQIATLAKMGRFCTETTCARLQLADAS